MFKQKLLSMCRTPKQVRLVSLTVVIFCLHSLAVVPGWAQSPGEIEIRLVEAKIDQPLACRVQLRNSSGNSVKPKSLDNVGAWSLVDSKLAYRGRPGDYDYEIYHGPEFGPARGRFTLDKKSEAFDTIELPRYADLASEGWLGGDMLSFLPPDRTARWLRAEELFWAASVSDPTSSKSTEKAADVATPEWNPSSSFIDKRAGSGLIFHHWHPGLMGDTATESSAEFETTPSSKLIVAAKKHQNENADHPVHVEVQKLWARDLPVWLASGRVDSVQLLSDHLTFDGKSFAEVKPLVIPEGKFQGGRAGGRMVEQIYWRMLDAGLRIPLTAGSGFGKSPSPMGYNRVYALVGSKRADNWWQAIRAGNSFVTNGPLLRVSVNGMPPGYLFQSDQAMELEIGATITVADPVEYLEVVHNGQSIYRAALDEYAKQGGKIPPLKVDKSGWLIVRVITGRDFSYRMATTSPFYFEIKGAQRIQAKSVEFFQRWLKAAREEIAKLPPDERRLHEPYLSSAEKFWQARLEQATE